MVPRAARSILTRAVFYNEKLRNKHYINGKEREGIGYILPSFVTVANVGAASYNGRVAAE